MGETLGCIRPCREGPGPVAPDPCAGGEGLLLPGKVALAFEQDGAAALVLVQEGAVLEVGDELVLTLHQRATLVSV